MPTHHVVASSAILVVTVVVVTACYALGCAVFPFTNCRWCGGNGKRNSLGGRHWRSCGRCQGTGRRPRAARAIWTALHTHGRHGPGGRL
jgi:hypothetical protein